MLDLEVKIAQTQDEIEAAQRLRFEVFHLEGKNKEGSTQDKKSDVDKFDAISKHLIVLDRNKNIIVGTYRLLFSLDVGQIGFNSEKTFDITNIRMLEGVKLELSRSCIHRDYRNSVVINLLWNGIAWQVKEHSVKYIFGCPRSSSRDLRGVGEAFGLLKSEYYSSEEFRVYPLPGNVLEGLDENIKLENPKKTFRRLSPLIKGYLNIGSKVCGCPALYQELDTVVFFVLLSTDKMVDSYRHHFLEIKTG